MSPLLESAYLLAFQVLLALFGGYVQPVMTCKECNQSRAARNSCFYLALLYSCFHTQVDGVCPKQPRQDRMSTMACLSTMAPANLDESSPY